MIKLTAPNGSPIHILRESDLSIIQEPLPALFAKGTRAIITVDSRPLAVTETAEEILRKLGAAV